jgi:hypothetical protein
MTMTRRVAESFIVMPPPLFRPKPLIYLGAKYLDTW